MKQSSSHLPHHLPVGEGRPVVLVEHVQLLREVPEALDGARAQPLGHAPLLVVLDPEAQHGALCNADGGRTRQSF